MIRASLFLATSLTAACASGTGGDAAVSSGGTATTSAGASTSPAPTADRTTSAAPTSTSDSPKAMVLVKGGTFKIGREGGKRHEGPPKAVTVASFYMDAREVTVADYKVCVDMGKCEKPMDTWDGEDNFCNAGKSDRTQHPINCVDLAAAKAFCAFAGKRLPTEVEWERAARGDDNRRFPWGAEEPNVDLLCWKRMSEKLGTCEVGSHPKGATPSGIYDLSGNVTEWTTSKYCPYDEPKCDTENIAGRGGSWDYTNPDNVSATWRGAAPSTKKRDLLGFRCVKDAG